jgi:cysteine desulfurase/selenocysteine lyase
MTSLSGALANMRNLFPQVRESATAYLDSAATTHKPEMVIQAMREATSTSYAPIHRGFYAEAEMASKAYEHVRRQCADLLGFNQQEIIFTRSATESINAVAESFLTPKLSEGDWVWVTELEHHANYLPWQRACQRSGAELKVLKIDYTTGAVSAEQVEELADERTKMLAITGQSNVLGVMPQLEPLMQVAHAVGATVLIDAAQCIAHQASALSKLDADFIVFSAHKVFGPTGVGVLAGRYKHLENMEPWLLGGGMVDWVGEGAQPSEWTDIPARFEAGSPNYIGVIGLGAALGFLEQLPSKLVSEQLLRIGVYAHHSLSVLPKMRMLTPSSAAATGVISFLHEDIHPHDLGQICADSGVAVRAGHHCAQPLMAALDIPACLRASCSVYTNRDDIDRLVDAVKQAERIFL